MKTKRERKSPHKKKGDMPEADLQAAACTEFGALINQSNARIYFKDAARRFVFANPATVKAVQMLVKSLPSHLRPEGKRDEDLFSGSHLKKAIHEDEMIIQGKHPLTKEKMQPGEWYECHELETWRGGRLVLVHTRKRPWHDGSRIIGLIGITRPVEIGFTEREFNKQIAPSLEDKHVVYGTYLERLSTYYDWLKKRSSKKAHSKTGTRAERHEVWFDEGFDRAFPSKPHLTGLDQDRFTNVLDTDKAKVLKFVQAARKLKPNTQSTIVFRAHVATQGGGKSKGDVVWIHATASVFERNGEPYLYVTHRNCRLEEVQEFFSRRILEKFPGNVFVKNRRHEFRYVNQNLADDLGECDPRSAIGKTDKDYAFPEEQIQKFHEADKKVMDGRKGLCHISPAEPFSPGGRPSADLVTIKFAISEADLEPWMDSNERLILGLSWKIDDEWLAYHDCREIWHSLIEYSSDAIYYKEPLGTYLHCNTEFAKLYEKTPKEIVGMHTNELLQDSPELLKRVLKEEKDILKYHKPIENQEHPFKRPGKKGDNRWISTKLPVFGSDKQTVRRILGLLRNREADDLGMLAKMTLSPRAIRARKAEQSAAHHTQVVLIFCDLRGFSKLASDLSSFPVSLVDLLKRYMNFIGDTADKHRFELDKFMGDGAMLFRLPDWDLDLKTERDSIQKICCAAVELAFDLIEGVPKLAAAWKAEHEFHIMKKCEITVGVGIHLGPATVGLIEGGKRLQFTALGPTVNDCSRFEGLAGKEGRPALLVSPQFAGEVRDNYVVTRYSDLKNDKMPEAFHAYAVKRKTTGSSPKETNP